MIQLQRGRRPRWWRVPHQDWFNLSIISRSAVSLERDGHCVYPIEIEPWEQPMMALAEATLSRYHPPCLEEEGGWSLPFAA